MGKMGIKSFLIAGCLLALVELGKCNVKCYTCNSIEHPNCEHPKNHKMDTSECVPTHLTEMLQTLERINLHSFKSSFDVHIQHKNDFGAQMNCLKLVTKGKNNKEVIVRGCQLASTENHGDICKKLSKDKKDDVKFCNLCNEDACNSSNYLTQSYLILLPLLILFKGLLSS